MIVRDPVVVAGTLPRFLNVGDQSRFFLDFDNVEGPAGDYAVTLDVRGPGAGAGLRHAQPPSSSPPTAARRCPSR